ncbi:MAG TPA: hypothetical protein VFR48_02085 [Solirubrobacteraceae bacterium]|nr:hypothetical protein [Solirubrobacteraceae bacterium]
MTGFDAFDRYDCVISLIFSVIFNAALVIGAPLWVLVLIMLLCSVVIFIRHFDEVKDL